MATSGLATVIGFTQPEEAVFLRSTPRLPTEVCEQILDVTPRSGDLRRCALVCRSWLPRSRLRLYYRIELDGNLQTLRLITAFETSPKLGRLVKILKLLKPSHRKGSDAIKPSHNWIYKAISALPRYLECLEVLHLYDLPPLHPIFPILCSKFTSIRQLEIVHPQDWSFCDVARMVNMFPLLQHLALSDCKWRRPIHYSRSKRHIFTTLRMTQMIDLDCGDDVLEWILASRSTSALTELYWSGLKASHNAALLQMVLQGCPRTLQKVYIGPSLHELHFTENTVLPCLIYNTALRHLHLMSSQSDGVLSYLSRLPAVAPTSLEVIRIYMEDFGQEKASWEGVDTALNDPRFARLRRFEVESPVNSAVEDTPATLQTLLPKSCLRGLLWIRRYLLHEPFIRVAPSSF